MYEYFYYPYTAMPNMNFTQYRPFHNSETKQNEDPEKAENGEHQQQQTFESIPPMMQPQSFDDYTQMPPQYFSQPQSLQQQMLQVERQLAYLISLMMENNRLLRSMQQMQQRVVTSGGGAVIVRM